MKSPVILDGDGLKFDPKFGIRTVTITAPTMITGSGHATIGETKMCIQGDEAKVQLAATYTTESHTVAGTGIVSIQALDSSQLAQGRLSGGVLITEGQQTFTASFLPSIPATTPPPASAPDAPAPSTGTGEFEPSQDWVNAG
ncbi:hypothetical protein [Shewanella sp. YLB-07]|uniref:hypothetical protein n=1 Tax=Shewanella sp. YLB-07 TaxID=2601268 RepID=UPI00128D5D84|nr:hypothetical protein [Shewanella sp. YLB-07]MPY24381.1 hypothetical protein [Shewanella sp. YLB-07]